MLLGGVSPVVAETSLPAPVVQFSFDGPDPRLETERGTVLLQAGGIKGTALKAGDPESRVFWRIPASGFDWKRGTISFWFRPIDWKEEGQLHHWLHTVAVKPAPAFHFHLCNVNSEASQSLFFGLEDLKRTRMHAWNGFTAWKNDEWYFVTATWGPATAAVYLNGECDRSGGGLRQAADLSIVPEMFENAILYIGAHGVKCWDGKKYATAEASLLDELEVRQEQLSDEQVRQLYYTQRPAASGKTAAAPSAPATPLPVPARSRLTVPADASAPQIDGSINSAEWTDAVSIVGLVNANTGFLSDRQFSGYLKSDGKKLYVAFRMTKLYDTEMLIRDRTARDSEVYLDDSWELYLYPGAVGGNVYQLVVNKLGAIYDRDGTGSAWNGNWEIKQNFGGKESRSPDLWEAEIAIPWADLGQADDVEGKVWRLGFFVNQKTPEIGSFAWTTQTGLFENAEAAAVLTFAKKRSAASLRTLGNPSIGMVSPLVEFSGQPQETLVSLQLPSGERISKTVEESGKAVPFAPLRGTGQALLTIQSPANAQPAQADFYYSVPVKYDSVPLTVKTTNYPSRKELCLEMNYGAFDGQGSVKQYLVSFGKTAIPCPRTSEIPWEKVTLSTAAMSPGEYEAEVSLVDAQDRKLVTQKFSYSKEGNEPWLNNTLGIIKGYVPSPYTPLEIKGRTVRVIGRTMTLAETGLPEGIESRGIAVLQAPVKLEGILAGKTVALTATKSLKFETINPDDSVGIAKVTLGPLRGTLKQTISFDGFCWYEIDLLAAKKVTAQGIALEIRMPPAVAKSYQLSGVDFKKTQLGLEEAVGDVLTTDMSLGFTGHVWLGNDEVGLAWMAESHRGWQVANDRKVIEIRRDQEGILLRVNIVDEPMELSGNLKIAFGLQASPVRPITERIQHITWSPGRYADMSPQAEVFGVYCGNNSATPLYAQYCGLPEPADAEACLQEAEKLKKIGFGPTPYSTITWLSLGVPEMKTYGGDWYSGQPWSSTAGANANPEPIGLCDTEDKNYQDFMVWRFVNLWQAYGGTSVYYDLFAPHQDASPDHKDGYKTRSGETAYPIRIRSVREMARRLYIAYRQKNPDFVCFANGGGGFWLPLVGFVDAVCAQHTDNVDKYPEMLTYDRYRSCFLGHNLGVKTLFLPNLKSPAQVSRMELSHYLGGIILTHNTTMWSCFIDRAAVDPYFRVYHGRDEWPMQTFLPYWRYPRLTNLDPEKFKVSGWYNEGAKKGLLCIASLSAEAVTVPVGLGAEWKSAGVAPRLTDACRQLEGWEHIYPSGQSAGIVGDYAFYLSNGKLGCTYDDKGVAAFKPYGVLMLEVK
jgi:hypothetical protein